jgi:FlaA1/EpsC-like NDP-sugar epimerase
VDRYALGAPPAPQRERDVNIRARLALAHDLLAVAVAWTLAFWLRFNLDAPPPEFMSVMLAGLPWVLVVHALVFWMLGLYRGLWRYASLPDLQRIVTAAGIGALAVPFAIALLQLPHVVPRSVYIMAPILLAAMMGGSRLAYRAWKERRLLGVVRHPRAEPVLVLGAGTAAAALVKDLGGSRAWRVVGLLDDDRAKHGGEIVGVKVLGALDEAADCARRYGVTRAIIAMPGASHEARRRAMDLCAAAGLGVMTVPAYADIVSGKVSVATLREVELDDLLGRDPVKLDDAGLHRLLYGKTVLVTGAGGSIGAELCRQIARFGPARIVLFEIAEAALYAIEREFRERRAGIAVTPAIGDAKDANLVADVFRRHAPQVVFHAAAYKHVPLMEEANAYQALRNNVLSTLVVARAAQAAGAEKFILVSTDKAVNPANVMGASKRVAELICQALQTRGATQIVTTQFITVRFGNVLGSSGSVVPLFREQIARGGPVTVTHPEMQRYFMSIPEAAQLVLQAALMGEGGEIFVLDMGEPVKIVDLARQLIRLSGLTEQDIRIEFIGMRAGEKLFEELLTDREQTLPTPHPKLHVARAATPRDGELLGEVERWLGESEQPDAAAVKRQLAHWVPEYRADVARRVR